MCKCLDHDVVSERLTESGNLLFTSGSDSRGIRSQSKAKAGLAIAMRRSCAPDAGESRPDENLQGPSRIRVLPPDDVIVAYDRLAQERSRFVGDLLSYMTLEEKLGQLDLFHATDDPALEKAIAAGRIGGVSGAAQPSRLQALATERSRLGIPLLLVNQEVDLALSPWALAASWDEELARAIGAAAAREAIGDGYNCMRAPRTDIATGGRHNVHLDGSEPYLSARLAAAFADGADGDGDERRSAVLAIPTWDAVPDGNGFAWSQSLAHEGNVAAIECLALDRENAQRAGFSGILVSECQRIVEILAGRFRQTSARSALESAERVLADGPVSEHELDMAVRGVLAAKHALGLFREPNRIVAPPAAENGYSRDDHRVRSTFVLLRNEAGLLPLSPVSDRVLVVGAADGAGAACTNALGRAGIAHSLAPGLAQRRAEESWAAPVSGDHFALSLTCDAARRADFVIVALDDRHFALSGDSVWRRPTPAALAMLRGLSVAGTRIIAIIASAEPVDLADADQFFSAVLQSWQLTAGFEEALSDVLSGRFSPQGRMPVSAGRFLSGHGLGFGECFVSAYVLQAEHHRVFASARIRNSGSFTMRETIQAYLRPRDDSGLRLIGFEHATLAPGEEAAVTFEFGAEALGKPGANGRLELVPGRYEILLGKSTSRLLSSVVEITPALARAMMLREHGLLRLAAG